MTLLELDGVARRYGGARLFGKGKPVHAVSDVSLRVEEGRTLALIGESGCGKSTTGRLALGLERPDDGEVRFQGAAMPKPGSPGWKALRARIQMVFQDPLGALDPRLSVATQIAEPLEIHGIGSPTTRRDKVGELLAGVGLRPDLGTRYPHELSGGQRQRAVLARALATDPVLLVCDEPISALDVSIQAQVVNLLMDVQEQRGLAMLFISHDLKVVRQIAHRVAVMYLGRIVEQGEPEALFAAPWHPYTRALVAAVPEAGNRRRGPRMLLAGEPPNPAARPSGCAFHPRCPLAVAICRNEVPPLETMPDGREVACHVVQAETQQMAA